MGQLWDNFEPTRNINETILRQLRDNLETFQTFLSIYNSRSCGGAPTIQHYMLDCPLEMLFMFSTLRSPDFCLAYSKILISPNKKSDLPHIIPVFVLQAGKNCGILASGMGGSGVRGKMDGKMSPTRAKMLFLDLYQPGSLGPLFLLPWRGAHSFLRGTFDWW